MNYTLLGADGKTYQSDVEGSGAATGAPGSTAAAAAHPLCR